MPFFIVANLGIFAGYLFIAFALAPKLPVKLWVTRVSGVLFFLMCGLTHLELAVHAQAGVDITRHQFTSWHMMTIHVLQVFAVWGFVLGLYEELVRRPQREGRASDWPIA